MFVLFKGKDLKTLTFHSNLSNLVFSFASYLHRKCFNQFGTTQKFFAIGLNNKTKAPKVMKKVMSGLELYHCQLERQHKNKYFSRNLEIS
jgi:hypothetical protein